MRTYDAKLIAEAVHFFRQTEDDFDAIKWVSDQDNIVLINEAGDLALFEHGRNPLRVVGHYYFKSRGKNAVRAAREFLTNIFGMGIQIITGLTPTNNLGAKWMSRHLGFTSHGVIDTTNGPHELFTLHTSEYTP